MESLEEYKQDFWEKVILFYYKYRKKLEKVHSLGMSKISFLLVPHTNKPIVNLNLSIYMILFLSFLFVSLTIFSFTYFLYFQFTKPDYSALYKDGNKSKVYFLHYNELSEDLDDSVKNLQKSYKDLNKTIWGESKKERFFEFEERFTLPTDKIELIDNEPLASNIKLYSQTVNKFSKLEKKLDEIKPGLSNAIDFLYIREGIFQAMPQGRPLIAGVGFVTSTFGHRSDPFYIGKGEFHAGLDIASPSRTPILATAPGIVSDLGNSEGGLGLSVRIDHENGFYTVYGHCSQILVKEGDQIHRGQIIGLVGSTGKATGSHLHYEVHMGIDPPLDPKEYINFE